MKLNICSDEPTPGCNSNSVRLPLVGNYAAKVLWEVLATPLTYKIVAYLKRVERGLLRRQHELHFTPFSLQV
jgi:queuosine precursor transporter